jgi:hypothetical protein
MANSTNNQRNFALDSNSRFGCTLFSNETLYAIQSFLIPGISFSPQKIQKRGVSLSISPDSITYDDLTISLIMDSKLTIWKEIVNKAHEMKDPTSDVNKQINSEAWIEVYNSNSGHLFNVRFFNVVLLDIGPLQYTSMGNDDEQTLDLTFSFSHFKIIS